MLTIGSGSQDRSEAPRSGLFMESTPSTAPEYAAARLRSAVRLAAIAGGAAAVACGVVRLLAGYGIAG